MWKKKYFSILLIMAILFSNFYFPMNADAATGNDPCVSTNTFEAATKVAVDINNNVYVFNNADGTIKKMDASGNITKIKGQFYEDRMGAFVVDTQGNIYYSKGYYNNGWKSDIFKIDNSGELTKIATANIELDTFGVDANGNVYYSSSYKDTPNLHKIDANGNHSIVGGYPSTTGVVSDVQGNVYLLSNGKITKIPREGEAVTDNIQYSYDSSKGLAADSRGLIYTPGDSDNTSNGIKMVNNAGSGTMFFEEYLKDTRSVAVDNDDNYYVIAKYTEDNSDFHVVVKIAPPAPGVYTVLGEQPAQDQAPVLVTQLVDQTANVNDNVQFSVQAQSCSNNFTYEWYKDDVKIEGAAGSTYSIENAQESNNGTYKVTVKNSAGEVSSNASLTVSDSTIKLDTIYEDTTDYEGTKTNVLSSEFDGTIITSADNTNGQWQYTDWQGNWANLDEFSEVKGYILGSDVKIRFIPKKDWNGIAQIEYRKLTDWYLAGSEDAFPIQFSTLDGKYDPTKPTEKASITVLPVNDEPFLIDSDDGIGFTKNLETNQDISVNKIFKTVDVDRDVVTIKEITSSNTDLVPVDNIEELPSEGNQNDKTLKITPAAGKSGETTISVKVCDQPEGEAPLCYESSFKLTVKNSSSTETPSPTPGPTVTLEPYEIIEADKPWGVTINGSSLYFVESYTKNIVKVSLTDNTRKIIQTGIDLNTSALTGIAITGDDVYISNINTIYKGKLSELENGNSSSLVEINKFENASPPINITGLTIDGQKEILYLAEQNRAKIYKIPLEQVNEVDLDIFENPWFDINPNTPTRYLKGITYYKDSIYGVSWDYDTNYYFYKVPVNADGTSGSVSNIGSLPFISSGSDSFIAGAPAIDENGKVYITDMTSKPTITTPSAPSVIADDDLNVINGADIKMEYSDDNGLSWTSFNYSTMPTFIGNQTVLVRYKAVDGVSYASPSTTLNFSNNPPSDNTGSTGGGETTPTPTPTPPSNGGGSGTGSTTEIITVDVDGESGENLNKTPIHRTTEANGTVKDYVTMPDNIAKDTVKRAKEFGDNTARIMIPDLKDAVSETKVEVPKTALIELQSGDLNLDIYTENATISIPKSSLLDFNDDLFFRLVPIKKEDERKQVEERAKKEEVVKEALGDGTIEVVGRPMTIETNLTSRKVDLILPLLGVTLPKDQKDLEKFLNNLGIFIEHSDGDRVLVKPEPVVYKDGLQGLKFTIKKFSTFTIVKMDNLDEYFDGKIVHKSYIQGTGNGHFAPNADVTRAQMAAMLARNLDKPLTTNLPAYQDVSSKHWAFADIMEAKNAGIMLGVSSTKFDPEGSVTRSQMAAIAYRWIQAECKNDSSAYESCGKLSSSYKNNYKDVAANHWAVDAINFLKATDIMVGYDDGNFHPEDKLTRAQAVKVLNRLFQRGPLTGVAKPTFKDVPTTHWAYDEIEEAAREHEYTADRDGKEILNK